MSVPIILASGSPRRKELLSQLGLTFSIIVSDVDEDKKRNILPQQLAGLLSKEKAKAVGKQLREGIVIGADTLVVYRNKILGKPYTDEKAVLMLQKICGKSILVLTGFTIYDVKTKKCVTKTVETTVVMDRYSLQMIYAYVATNEPHDKAGAFGIQGKGVILVKRIDGDYSNIVGLPLFALVKELKKFGVHVFM